MAAADRLQDPYLYILYIFILEHLKIYNKAIFGLLENYRYDTIRSKWVECYQELEDDVFTFVFKAAVLIVTVIYGLHAET